MLSKVPQSLFGFVLVFVVVEGRWGGGCTSSRILTVNKEATKALNSSSDDPSQARCPLFRA